MFVVVLALTLISKETVVTRRCWSPKKMEKKLQKKTNKIRCTTRERFQGGKRVYWGIIPYQVLL